MLPYFCPYLRQILTDFKNSFTGAFCGKFAIKWLLVVPNTPKLRRYTTLWNINVSKTNNSWNQFVHTATFRTRRKFAPRSQQMIRTTLDSVRPVSLDTWRVERCVCGWSSWLCTSLSTVVSGHVLFNTLVLWSATPVLSVGAFCFLNLFQKLLNAPLVHFISAKSVSSLREPYSLYCFKFWINA